MLIESIIIVLLILLIFSSIKRKSRVSTKELQEEFNKLQKQTEEQLLLIQNISKTFNNTEVLDELSQAQILDFFRFVEANIELENNRINRLKIENKLKLLREEINEKKSN